MLIQNHRFSIKAFQEGDPRAFAFIFAIYYPSLCYFANQFIIRTVAEEIIQDAFITLWQKHTAFHCQRSIKTFLYVVTRNACINFLKQWQRQKKYEELWAFRWKEESEDERFEMNAGEMFENIHAAIQTLPSQCRKIISLSYLNGLKNQEIADQLQLSVQTVKNQKQRGVQLLKKRLNFA
ncbi:MAG TPA: RNA polymerase sigma-70 factor [Chitinophagaceae bacterium]